MILAAAVIGTVRVSLTRRESAVRSRESFPKDGAFEVTQVAESDALRHLPYSH